MEKIIVLQNCILLTNSVSGGDIIFPKMSPYLTKQFEVHVVGNKLTKSIWTTYGAKTSFHLYHDIFFGSSQRLLFGPLKYLLRTYQSTRMLLSLIKKLDGRIIIYSSSDYFPDIIPAFIAKIFYPQSLWVGRIYHLIPLPWKRENPFLYSLFSFLSQRASFLLLRLKANKVFVLKNAYKNVKGIFPSHLLKTTSVGTISRKKKQAREILYDSISIGTISQNRGVFDLIPIWRLVVDELPNAKLVLVGGGSSEYIQKLELKIRKYHLHRNISYLGSLSEKRLHSVLKKSKLHLSTRREGGASIPTLEAAIWGVPTVAYASSAFKKRNIPGCILVPTGMHMLFAKKIISLISDKKRYHELAKKTKRASKQPSWKYITETFTKEIEKLTLIQ
ncbi:glycosyltransferase [Candidatus Gottesmanbacteria bacterium]|nr:glycosyltransferase [Candidatus Gottesmanbacteria bacterium]